MVRYALLCGCTDKGREQPLGYVSGRPPEDPGICDACGRRFVVWDPSLGIVIVDFEPDGMAGRLRGA